MLWSFCGAEYGFAACGGSAGFWGGGGGFGGHIAEFNREYGGLPPNIVGGMQTYNERVMNAQNGNGFRTNQEVSMDFQIVYWFDEEGNLHTDFVINVQVGESSPLLNTISGSLDSWPPQWPRRVDGYDPKYGWKSQPAPDMEQFPKKVGIGPESVQNQPEFDPSKSPSNASKSSQFFRGAFRLLGDILGGIGNRITIIISVPYMFFDPCLRNMAHPGCAKKVEF